MLHPYLFVINQAADLAMQCGRDPKDILIVAVSKGVSLESIEQAILAGALHFGESRVQEALEKIAKLTPALHWHLIGSLQLNKVRKAVSLFSLIHSVDSLELAKKISDCSEEMGKKTAVLLQVNTSGEKSKHGFAPGECQRLFEQLTCLPGIEVSGLMTMAPFVGDQNVIRHCFSSLRALKDKLSLSAPNTFKHLSMGMSHDYPIAIEEGATILRIGSAIFNPGLLHR